MSGGGNRQPTRASRVPPARNAPEFSGTEVTAVDLPNQRGAAPGDDAAGHVSANKRPERRAQHGHRVADGGAAQGRNGRARDWLSVAPRRLLSLEEGAHYLNLSFWSFRELVNAGDVPLIRVPRPRTMRQHKRGARSDTLRRTLVDVRDLDALVDRWREGRDG